MVGSKGNGMPPTPPGTLPGEGKPGCIGNGEPGDPRRNGGVVGIGEPGKGSPGLVMCAGTVAPTPTPTLSADKSTPTASAPTPALAPSAESGDAIIA